jgi:hypothetical protein
VKNSNANENKQLISPSIAENAVCAANFAPFLHFFENHFQFQLLRNCLALLFVGPSFSGGRTLGGRHHGVRRCAATALSLSSNRRGAMILAHVPLSVVCQQAEQDV